jgi:hypothetical protein
MRAEFERYSSTWKSSRGHRSRRSNAQDSPRLSSPSDSHAASLLGSKFSPMLIHPARWSRVPSVSSNMLEVSSVRAGPQPQPALQYLRSYEVYSYLGHLWLAYTSSNTMSCSQVRNLHLYMLCATAHSMCAIRCLFHTSLLSFEPPVCHRVISSTRRHMWTFGTYFRIIS